MKKLFSMLMLTLATLHASTLSPAKDAETKEDPADKVTVLVLPIYRILQIGTNYPPNNKQKLLSITAGIQTKTEKDQKFAVRTVVSGSIPLEFSNECNTYELDLPRLSILSYLTSPNRATRLYVLGGTGVKARFTFKRNQDIWACSNEDAIMYEIEAVKETVQLFASVGLGAEYAKEAGAFGIEASADLPLLNLNLPLFKNGSHFPSFKIGGYFSF